MQTIPHRPGTTPFKCIIRGVAHLNLKWERNANTWCQQQIDDTVGVMRENINKVSQRGERLDSLQDKTDNLAVSAQGFRRGANRVRKQMWWKVKLAPTFTSHITVVNMLNRT